MATRDAKKGYSAVVKHVMMSPTKLRRVADTVRRKPYTEAVAILESLPQRGALPIKKIIQSAAANALYQNKNLDEDMLFIKELRVDEGPRMKRLWARGRGRRDILQKKMSHLSVILDEITGLGA
ncbi:MAG: 50S ribosomal protein L22 [Spirochaetales bacterium]|nr:50S ribosomal protein L22 [Spirochaetales bacterium]